MTGCLLGIARRAGKRAEMELLDWADVTLDAGVVGDFRGVPGVRQVTVMSREAWQRVCTDVGHELPWQTRRANLLVEGLELFDTTDRLISIGDVQLLVTRETDPCRRMEEALEGLSHAMISEWRGGACCRVIVPGRIRVGDKVKFSDE